MTGPWFAQEFVSHLGQAIEMMSGERPDIDVESAGTAPDAGSLIREQSFSVKGSLAWLAGPEAAWVNVGAASLRAAGIEEDDPAAAKSTFVEILNQAFSGLAREITTRIQREVNPADGADVTALPEVDEWRRITIRSGEDHTVLHIAFNDTMSELLDPVAVEPIEPAKRIGAPERSMPAGVENSKTLELLLDVELPVSVSFGRTQLPLKDVIKLTTGSIVELNRGIGEPVEVIVNNCVIARGEVVVVEGNFGVRILQVVSRQERLRTLY